MLHEYFKGLLIETIRVDGFHDFSRSGKRLAAQYEPPGRPPTRIIALKVNRDNVLLVTFVEEGPGALNQNPNKIIAASLSFGKASQMSRCSAAGEATRHNARARNVNRVSKSRPAVIPGSPGAGEHPVFSLKVRFLTPNRLRKTRASGPGFTRTRPGGPRGSLRLRTN